MNQETIRRSVPDMLIHLSTLATCPRLQVGAMIIKPVSPFDDSFERIISTGFNGAAEHMTPCAQNNCRQQITSHPITGAPQIIHGCRNAIHAEIRAIGYACELAIPLHGTHLYSTHVPCIACAHVIIACGIRKVFFMADYRDPLGKETLIEAGIKAIKMTRTDALCQPIFNLPIDLHVPQPKPLGDMPL